MKDFRKIFLTVLILCAMLLAWVYPSVQAYADDGTGEQELNATLLEQMENLDFEKLQAYIDSLGLQNEQSVRECLFAYINGGEIEYQAFFNEITNVLLKNFVKLVPAFACICAISILCGIVNQLRSGLNAKTSGQAISFVAYLSALIPLISILIECVSTASESVEHIQTQAQLIFPLIITLLAASGQTATVAVCQPTVAFLSSTVLSVINEIIFPLTITILAFSMISSLSTDMKLEKFSAFLKSINKWTIGITLSVFGVFFSAQGLVASTYDGITKRVAKYAIGTGVPIVGGFLSGGFDLAIAGSILIKNSLGVFGIFLIISVLFQPLSLLITTNIMLRLTSAITQPFGDNKISDFLSKTADDLSYCTAGVLLSAFMYVVCIVISICASEAIL